MPNKSRQKSTKERPQAANLAQDQPDRLSVGEIPLKKNISKSTIIKFVIAGVIVLLILGYLTWDVIAKGPLMQLY